MQEQRKQHYNDQKIQGYFLAALIGMELVLAGLLMVYLYIEVNNIIDGHLYQMHGVASASWSEIFALLVKSIGGFVVVNLVFLSLGHFLWGRYVGHILTYFSSGLDKVLARDFSDSPELKQSNHHLINLLNQWLQKEHCRNRKIAELLDRLSDSKDKTLEKADRRALQQTLEEYRHLLGSQSG